MQKAYVNIYIAVILESDRIRYQRRLAADLARAERYAQWYQEMQAVIELEDRLDNLILFQPRPAWRYTFIPSAHPQHPKGWVYAWRTDRPWQGKPDSRCVLLGLAQDDKEAHRLFATWPRDSRRECLQAMLG